MKALLTIISQIVMLTYTNRTSCGRTREPDSTFTHNPSRWAAIRPGPPYPARRYISAKVTEQVSIITNCIVWRCRPSSNRVARTARGVTPAIADSTTKLSSHPQRQSLARDLPLPIGASPTTPPLPALPALPATHVSIELSSETSLPAPATPASVRLTPQARPAPRSSGDSTRASH